MSDEKNMAKKKAMLAERRRRVNRIKKMIIIIIVVFLLLPSLLCVSLWVKVVRLEKKLDQYMGSQEERYAVSEEIDDTILAAKIEGDPTEEPAKITGGEDQSKIKGKKVYLTFDDGPSQNTEEILDILKKENIKATFFVIGQTDEHSLEMYKRIYDEGHTLAMHSYTHQYSKIYKSVDAYKKDMTKLSDLLYGITGERPYVIRFPGGSSNTVSDVDMKKIIQYTKEAGYRYFDWNVINGDATGKTLSDKEMVNNVISGVELYENSVVLMHDCAGKQQTVKTLPSVIKKLKKMDVTMLPINETTKLVQHVKVKDMTEE